MGFDTSFHPVDLNLIQNRLIPYIANQGDIRDLVADAVRMAKVRFRANAWGLGTMSAAENDDRFDSRLYVWGRPFFITVEGPENVSKAIDTYLAAKPEDVDEIAREMLRTFDPSLVDRVKPDTSGHQPSDDKLASGITWRLELLRDAYAHQDKAVVRGEETYDPHELLTREIPLSVLEFAAHLRPGWMDRGVWPTRLIAESNVDAGDLFEEPTALLGAFAKFPPMTDLLSDTITENYMVGGFVPPAKVPALRQLLQRDLDTLIAPARADGWEDEARRSVRKMIEALVDAERKGFGFAEATEIYEPMRGVMN